MLRVDFLAHAAVLDERMVHVPEKKQPSGHRRLCRLRHPRSAAARSSSNLSSSLRTPVPGLRLIGVEAPVASSTATAFVRNAAGRAIVEGVARRLSCLVESLPSVATMR
jgi:hypothetical protein